MVKYFLKFESKEQADSILINSFDGLFILGAVVYVGEIPGVEGFHVNAISAEKVESVEQYKVDVKTPLINFL